MKSEIDTNESATLSITLHAYERGKERMNWNRKVLDKMASKAFSEGIKHKETKGKLNRYISSLFFKYGNANNIRIYGQTIFLFQFEKLITLYQIPNQMKKYLK